MTVFGFKERRDAETLKDIARRERPPEKGKVGSKQNREPQPVVRSVGKPQATIAAGQTGTVDILDESDTVIYDMEVLNPHSVDFTNEYKVEVAYFQFFDLPIILPWEVSSCEEENGPVAV